MFLLVVEDRHAERDLRTALASARARRAAPVVLTTDARLALDALPAAFERDGRDAAAALGTSYGAYLHYTLLPAFIRAVRNLAAIDDVWASGTDGSSATDGTSRILLVGGGPLVD